MVNNAQVMKKSIAYFLLMPVLSGSIACCDEVIIRRGGQRIELSGEILVEAQKDNGILFQSRDGRLWRLAAAEIESKQNNDESLPPLTRKELGQQIQSELNSEFKIHEADEFVIVYNTETAYARWVAGLYRRFERGFSAYWARNRFRLEKPEFPLAVIIFKSRGEYEKYMSNELGIGNSNLIAYYNFESNRVVMFDLTAGGDGSAGKSNDPRRINNVLNNPDAIPMVATIIHEGTHQLMFNNGMQSRFSDTPLWINEGLAMFFEVPDLESTRGWGKIGQVNFLRLGPVLQYFRTRPADSLKLMIQSDEAFRGQRALDMYAQAWAFNYFLLNRHKERYVEYLQKMSKKPLLIYDSPEQRLADFQEFFEQDFDDLDREFVQYIRSLDR